ncbi:hypothetical protein M9H77_29659 [Catharanthus roseus]|uniref:Uncharacterized protein n=1 Tax=Catharanthus roseus TaxID=4058 RepID=A0ACB9ZXN2_CATRO|nr:hypothetical protein M9H77_29659 [Catharanthus roseus]
MTSLMISTDGHMPTQSHQEGPSDPSKMNLNKTLRDIEELKKAKRSATMEQRVGDNLGGFNSPYHQRPYDNVSTYGYHDMLVQHSHPIHDFGYQGRPQHRVGRRGGIGGRGYHRSQEVYPRGEAWHDDNFFEDDGDNPNSDDECQERMTDKDESSEY